MKGKREFVAQWLDIIAATSLLAGLVLKKEVIQQVLREEIRQESVIYQDIKEKGIRQGQAILVLRQLKRRIGKLESEDETHITGLSVEQLEALGEALLDFSNRDDLLTWFANN
jgi:predicted transposase YdaD